MSCCSANKLLLKQIFTLVFLKKCADRMFPSLECFLSTQLLPKVGLHDILYIYYHEGMNTQDKHVAKD